MTASSGHQRRVRLTDAPGFVTRSRLLLIALLLNCAVARADDRQAILSALGARSHLLSLRISRPWARLSFYTSWPSTVGPITLLLYRCGGHWLRFYGGGGYLSVGSMWRLGVPRARWVALMGRAIEPADQSSTKPGDDEALTRGPLWPETSRRPVDLDRIGDSLEAWELVLMRNEIFARHGRPFRDPMLREYFSSRPWYHADPRFTDSRLSALEMHNARAILSFQRRTGRLELPVLNP